MLCEYSELLTGHSCLSGSQRHPPRVHPSCGWTWGAGLGMGSLSASYTLRSCPLNTCGPVIRRLVVRCFLWLPVLFSVVISEYPLILPFVLDSCSSMVFIVHFFDSLYPWLLTNVNITV